MRDIILKTYLRLRYNDEGVTLVEYGIAIALAVFLGVGALTTLGTEISAAMGAAGTQMPN